MDAAEPDELRRQLDALIAVAAPFCPKQQPTENVGYIPFPVCDLPDSVQTFVREAARAIGCDPAFVVLPLLATLASAIGNTRRIMLKVGWCEPSILWTAIVGESGTHKTPAINAATAAISRLQEELLVGYRSRMEDYELDKLKYEADLSDWKRLKGDTRGDPPEKPSGPVARRLIVSDATIEALADRLADAPRGLLLVRDELAGWLLSFDAYKSGKGGDAAHWLSLYNAQPLRMDRKTGDRKLIHVPVASVSIAGGIQPETLRRALGREHFENGLAARLLMASPPKRPRTWTEATIDEAVQRGMKSPIERLLFLDFDYDTTGAPRPIDLPLTATAKARWIDFCNQHGKELVELSGHEAALWSKLEGTAARLALIVQLASDPDSVAVNEASMTAGIALANWFGAEGRRILRILNETDEERARRELVELIRLRSGGVTVRDLMRGPRSYREEAIASHALHDLAVRNLGHWVHQAAGAAGGRPTSRFVLFAPGDGDETPDFLAEGKGSVPVAASEQSDQSETNMDLSIAV